MILRVEINLALLSPNRLHSEYFRARAARRSREHRLTLAALAGLERPPLPVKVTICRCGPRTLDDDNLQFSAKAVRDAIGAWLTCGDGPNAPVTWAYTQHVERIPCVVRDRRRQLRRAMRQWIRLEIATVES